MAINLTLNDFRGVLGIKNDGDVVMKLDQSGIEKANWGNGFMNLFRTVRKVQPGQAENLQIRQALLVAINNSSEGKALSGEDIGRIYAALGMDGNGAAAFSAPLTRRELKNVIDIIDRATEGDKLVDKSVESLSERGVLDEKVSGGVKKAMRNAPFSNPPAKLSDRIAAARAFFGADFKGRSPVEMEKFVRLNMAVIREQLFDRLYWSNQSLKDFTAAENLNVAQIMEVAEEDFVQVGAEAVADAFREVVGSLMERFAACAHITTRLDTLAPCPDEVDIKDSHARNVWNTVINGDDLETLVKDVFVTTAENTDSFTALQLRNAATAVVNMLRDTFATLFVQNRSNTQDTQRAFKEKTDSLIMVLEEIVADKTAVRHDASGKFLVNVARELAKIVPDKNPATSDTWLADAALKALDNASKNVSSRHLVENYVKGKLVYLDDKKPAIDFFMEKISKAGQEGGITADQRKVLTDYQRAILLDGGLNTVVARDLENLLMVPLAAAYNDLVTQNNPQKVREVRQIRNTTAFSKLVQTLPGYDKLAEDKKGDALIKLRLETLIAKFGHAKVFELGISAGKASESVKAEGDVYDENALKILDEQLLAMDDREFEFYSQYCAKRMRYEDNTIVNTARVYIGQEKSPVFRDALRDGMISISSVPAAAVPMLGRLIDAQIFAISVMNGGFSGRVSIRDLLPAEDASGGSLATALMTRLNSRIVAAGLKPPPACSAPKPEETEKDVSYRLSTAANSGYGLVRGFGTMDLGRILKLFGDMGVDLAPLDGNDVNAKVNVYEKVISLSLIAVMSGYKLDDLAEFTERVVGKPFGKVNLDDVLKALNKNGCVEDGKLYARNLTESDPIATLKGDQKTVKEFLAGEMSLPVAKLASNEVSALLATARDLAAVAPGKAKSAVVKLKGVDVELNRLVGGELSVKIGKWPMRAAFDTHGLVRMLENEITAKPNEFDAQVVNSTLPTIDEVRSGAVPLVRARELYAKTAAAKTGQLPVMFSSYATERLCEIAIGAVDGTFTVADMPKAPPASYNSGAMLEMHANLSLTSAAEVESKVKIAAPPSPSIELRRTVAPEPQTVRNLVADLFLNKDTWEFDNGRAPGERIRKLILENEPELAFVIRQLDDGYGFLSPMPAEVRDVVKAIFEDIRAIDIAKLKNQGAIDEGVRNALAAIETKIDAIANTIVDAMQAKVTALFAPKAGVVQAKPDWQKTFSELTGKEGIDANTKQGKFTLKVLDNYFKNSAGVDKRAMLSAFIRNTDDASSDAKQVAELLKGAGPLLQKMLQGLPLSTFDEDTQLALKDMKSRLLPIPAEAVKAQMLELVNSSQGNILSIEVKRSLGAATVGQAFLCNIKTKDHPFIGEECVIKLLRPNVDTAIQREKAMIDKLVENDPAMKATFDGQYRKILEEFDLTLESTNVGIGTKFYERPSGIKTLHSMEMLGGMTSTMTSMVVKKAEGTTFDATVERVRSEARELLEPFRHTTEVGGVIKTVYKAPTVPQMAIARRTLLAKAAQLNDRRNHILDVTKAWFGNALFGNGFFHGDLHGGNLMTGTGGTTFIDFGNCSHLTKDEQTTISMMLASTVSGDVDHVVNCFKRLLPAEARNSFDAKFQEGSQAMKDLVAIMGRGNALDLMSRLQAFIAVVQGADVPIPAALQNFVQSYMRLADIVSDIDRTVEDLQIEAAALYCDAPGLAAADDDPQIFANFKAIVRAYVGDANTPCSLDAVRQATETARAYAGTQAFQDDIRALLRDDNGELSVEKAMGKLRQFMENVYYSTKCFTQNDINPSESRMAAPAPLGPIREAFERLDLLREEDKLTPDSAKPHLESIEKALGKLYNSILSYYQRGMSLEWNGKSTFGNVAEKNAKSMTDICCDVILDNSDSLRGPARQEYDGIAGAIGFAGRLKRQLNAAGADVARRKNIGPEIAKENDKLSADDRLSGMALATLMRATNTYFTPTPRPDAGKPWVKTPEGRRKVLETIAYNLQRGAEALGVQHLTAAAAGLAALNFGLSDKTLAESILALENADYNALLAQAQQLDAAQGDDVHELAKAVEALRGSRNMLTEVSKDDGTIVE